MIDSSSTLNWKTVFKDIKVQIDIIISVESFSGFIYWKGKRLDWDVRMFNYMTIRK